GGAGRLAPQAAEQPPPRAAYDPPADAFAWPRDAERGDDMMAELRARGASSSSPGARGTSADGSVGADPARAESPWSDAGGGPAAAPSVAASARAAGMPPAPGRDDRPVSTVSIAVVDSEAHRGRPLRVRGEVRADSEPCAHVAVEVWLRAAERERSFLLGSLATADDGAFSGAIVLPPDVALGDYDVVARTRGDVRCGAGTSE
ncbi:MAG TPA: hypothetical protein VE987_01165, partial [Polyangiaceae bacterium]|nr:hypothetical protein [Polyangiaceae bacterium]